MRSDPAAERAERLRLPPDLSGQGINDNMAVPAAERAQRGPLLADPQADVKVRAAGDQRWLSVAATPEQVWKWLHGYLAEHGVKIASESPQLGVIRTDWILNSLAIPRGVFAPTVKGPKDAQVADRYVFRIEPGPEAGTTEVFVAHRRIAAEQAGADAKWALRDADSFLEAEMLRGLMLYLGQQKLQSMQQMAAAEAGASQAQLARGEQGQVQLVLAEDMFDAWRRLGLAIDRLGFTLEDRNRSEGRYYVRYDPEAETGRREKGFFESLAFWRDEAPESVPLYVIQLREAGEQTVVTVTTEAGEPVAANVAERILALLQEQLR